MSQITIAAKCAPDNNILSYVKKAGLEAVELYLSKDMLNGLHQIIQLCKNFPFRYAIHAPNEGYDPLKLVELSNKIDAEIIVFHDIYWESEWENIVKTFKNTKTTICIENTYSVHEPLKFIRRYGLKRCLDLEHLQQQCAGVFEEEFIKAIKQASHIHLTGYIYGSQLWHTHIHHSPKHSLYLLNLLEKTGYSGLVVSEAKASLQTYKEFKELNEFYQNWKDSFTKKLNQKTTVIT